MLSLKNGKNHKTFKLLIKVNSQKEKRNSAQSQKEKKYNSQENYRIKKDNYIANICYVILLPIISPTSSPI